MNELAKIVPVSNNRIMTNGYYQIDLASNQILISIKILKSDDSSVINVSSIVKTLNKLMKNKERTSISENDLLLMLDESYGIHIHGK